MKFHNFIAFLAILSPIFTVSAAAPAGYYNGAENKGGQSLLTALSSIVGPHTTISYDGLLALYQTTDVYPDGKIWDMYSTKHWNAGTTCGNYSYVGDCYNREHSMPKSWFNNSSPMNSDAFHVYPTDGKVNGQRSNYPYGECTGGTYLASHNGIRPLGRLGNCTSPGYSGKVFEPDDEYKGDFARSYFYMAAAYNSRISSWNSDMLAGNKFPAFKQWAIDVLLKWHRQDPVSQKELDRNEAVYARQHNRNPFIDHPEMAEFIWGNKSSLQWTSAGNTDPEFVLPASGSIIDFGTSAVSFPLRRSVTVRTSNATAPVSISISGNAFTSSASSLAAAQTNSAQGTTVEIVYNPSSVGTHGATLTLSTGNTTRTVSLTGTCVSGLPAGEATFVTDRSFRANWTFVGDADASGCYTLTVTDINRQNIAGYPKAVAAAPGFYEVEDLDASTSYIYTISSRSLTSREISVTTGEALPSIDFLFDGELNFTTTPGEPSAAAELLMETDNIEGDVTVTVTAPFEVSDNHSTWSNTLTVSSDAGRIYLRLNSAAAGTFTGTLTAGCGSYTSDAIYITGTASAAVSFHEDFEADAAGFGGYNGHDDPYQGTAAAWWLDNVGIWSSDPAHEGNQSVRFGKTDASYIQTTTALPHGIGMVSFWAKYWSSEANPTIAVQYSTDGGEHFTTAGVVTVSTSTYAQYSVHAGVAQPAILRLQQLSGSRLNLDDVELSDYSTGVSDPAAARHLWDAFCVGNTLMLNVTNPQGIDAAIYSIDGREIFAGHLNSGSHSFDNLAASLYIVVSDDFARRVLVR